ncbi:MAG TPA: rod shape-determining protein [Firmicutes bacterium]|nr:rod shape-determining protein [Bacillota bacterium]
MALDIGIDLGTATILVYVRGRGIVVKEPSVVAISTETGKVLFVGEEARQMIGRTPGHIQAVRPLREGVIADYDHTRAMLQHFIRKVCGASRFFKPRVAVSVPASVTSVERRAVRDAALEAGAKQVCILEEPMAAAIGAGLPIAEPSGNMVVDIGGGTSDVAVISLGGIVVGESLRVAGDKFDEAIARHIRKTYNLMVGERTAEDIKLEVGTAYRHTPHAEMEVKGRDLMTGLPRIITYSSEEAYQALEEPVRAIVDGIKAVLERTPPELAADIFEKGIVMTGGGALLKGFDQLLSEETGGIPVFVADDPQSCVAVGTGRVLEGVRGVTVGVWTAKTG